MNVLNETILHIDLNKLEKNFLCLKNKLNPKTKIIGVVKAYAYGHGDVYISKKLESLGIHALWVSDFEEGINLRKSGIKIKIIVANPGIKSYQQIIKYKLDVVLYNKRLLDLYCLKKNKLNIHVKFNTGMNRYGFNSNEIKSIVSKIQNNPHLSLQSICSHLADSNEKTKIKYTITQIKNFKSISKSFQRILGEKIDCHILNTNGLLNFPEYQMDSVRIGIGFFGSTFFKGLEQISSLYSVITQIRNLSKGCFLGYGAEFIADKKMKIAIIPLGYADGINRRLSNNIGSVFINNKECAIVGKISMDSLAVDVSNIKTKEGDLVEIFGDRITVSEIAKKINTIPYEIYSSLNRRIKRIYSDS